MISYSQTGTCMPLSHEGQELAHIDCTPRKMHAPPQDSKVRQTCQQAVACADGSACLEQPGAQPEGKLWLPNLHMHGILAGITSCKLQRQPQDRACQPCTCT